MTTKNKKTIEIKFRVWDKKINKMISFGELFAYRTSHLPSENGVLVEYGLVSGKVEKIVGITPKCEDYFDDFELTQFTGLTDKNGKEIYEGDIVAGLSGFGCPNIVIVREPGAWNCSYAIQEFEDKPEEDWEILGNIYQNPELLKDSK